MSTKTCARCKKPLPFAEFQKRKDRRDGLRSECKACRSVETRVQYIRWRDRVLACNKKYAATPEGRRQATASKAKYRTSHREEINAAAKRRRRTDRVPWMLYSTRSRAKRKGMAFNLTSDDLVLPERCPVLGIPLIVGDGKLCQNSPSLDRIDNTKGYVRGNVIIVSHRANAIKNDATVEELGKVYRFYKRRAALAVAVTWADKHAKS